MERIVITGPTGSIGHALIEKYLSEGAEVYAICHPDSRRNQTLLEYDNLHMIFCNLNEFHTLKEKIDKPCDVFFHFAWAGTTGENRDNAELQADNIIYTLSAVNAAIDVGCHTFIGAGSQAEYGRVNGSLTPETPTFPENGYGIAKLSAGMLSRLLCREKGIRHIWVRILSIYGPYDNENSMIMSTIRKLLNQESPDLTQGIQKWDYLYSEDAAIALKLLAESGKDGKVYTLGSGNAYPLKNYILEIYNQTKPTVELGFGKIPYGKNQIMNLCADISELQKDTGFKPCYSFEKGITKTINWYKDKMINENN